MAYSTFQRRLMAGQKVVTGEIAPPKGTHHSKLEHIAEAMRNVVDVINLTDNQRGVARMSALGAGILLKQMGLEPVVQMTCQHRNRIALQADVLSASALGIRNILAMTGDTPKVGDHPDTKPALDLNSFRFISMLRKMRDERVFENGQAIKEGSPRFFLGAVANPNMERIERLEKKIEAGAEFIQTQIIFDLERFREWMQEVRSLGLHRRAYILAGIMVVKTPKTVQYLRDHLPGMCVPEEVVTRMEGTSTPDHEGIALAAELVQDVLSIEGVAGVHLMSVNATKAIPAVIERAGLLPRPLLPDTAMLEPAAQPSATRVEFA